MPKQKLCQKCYCLFIPENSNNNYYIVGLKQKADYQTKSRDLKNNNQGNKPDLLLECPNHDIYFIYFKCSQKYLSKKPKVKWNKLLKIGIAIITALLTSLTPVNQETLDTQDTQTQTIQILQNYVIITRLILQFYGK
ncbi:MAG: hypothetical protein MGG11_02960 [Trichodesmium sp. MAG_R03]|nr:hypothetical protein [Trichodesmium sp. MAG_R03]